MARDITIRYVGDASSAQRAARAVADANGRLTTNFDKTTKGISARFGGMKDSLLRHSRMIGLGLVGVGLVAVKLGTDFVQAAEESQKVGKQTNAVIKSTGGVANVTADQVAKLAEKLSIKAGIDDELIQSGANVLLTFKNVRDEVGKGNDIFTQATTAALDMSVALGTDLQTNVIQVGKALQDPIAGLSSLRRVGVTFSDDQKAVIAKLVETGDVLGAQKIILQELTSEFGGSAEAQATASGKLQVAWDNLKEKLGAELLPVMERFSDWMVEKGIPKIQEFAGWIKDTLVPAFGDIKTWVEKNVIPPLESMWRVFHDDILPIFQDITRWINEKLVPAFGSLKDAITGSNDEAKNSGPSWAGWAAAIGGVAIALGAVAAAAAPLVPILKGLGGVFGFVGGAAMTMFQFILRNLPFAHIAAVVFLFRDDMTGAFTFIRDKVVAVWTNFWATTKEVASNAWAAITARLSEAWEVIKQKFADSIANIKSVWSNMWTALWGAVQTGWAPIGGFFSSLPGRFRGFVSGAAEWLLAGGRNVMRGFFTGIKNIWNDIIGWFKGLPSKILDILGINSPPKWAVEAGAWILKGITKGLGLGVGSVWDFMGNLAGKFTGPLKTAWDGVSGFFASLAGNVAGFFGGGGGSSNGLVGAARQAMTLFQNMFPGMTIGGWRARGSVPGSDHPKGKALDLMTMNGSIAQQIIRTFRNMAGAKYWIWNREMATAASGWRTRRYTGPNPHTDHVHLSFFKKGGLVPGPIGAPQAAVVHGGEMVFTPDQMRALGGRRGGPTVLIERISIQANTEAEGQAASKGFLDVLAQRRVLTDARIR